jgi:hypothetical protein
LISTKLHGSANQIKLFMDMFNLYTCLVKSHCLIGCMKETYNMMVAI